MGLLAVAPGLGGCGTGDRAEDVVDTVEESAAGTRTSGGNGSATSALRFDRRAGTEPYERRRARGPDVRLPSGPPPRRLRTDDLVTGDGPTAHRGDEVVVNYDGYLYSTGRRYDTSYGRDPLPLKVVPGRDDFIDGFEEGIVGMRVGGRRQITIPPHKAYGDRGYPPDVEPGETVVFVVDLEAILERRVLDRQR